MTLERTQGAAAESQVSPCAIPEHRLLQGVQVGLASVEGAASEVDAHGVDADIVWGREEAGLRQEGGEGARVMSPVHPGSLLTDVVGLIKDHDGLAGQLLGH